MDSLQPPFSLIRRQAGAREIPWCAEHGTGVIVYSPMQSGLLTDRFSEDRVRALPSDDWRRKSSDFNPPQLARNLALRDGLRPIAERHRTTVAQVAIAWTLAWPGVTAAIVGARTPEQVDGWIDAGSIELGCGRPRADRPGRGRHGRRVRPHAAGVIMSIHHVTAIVREPQRNLDFYAGTLGMRLVKLTVNYDDPGRYHLYYGDELGRPGSLLTFFPWTTGRPGRQGTGQINGVALAVPTGSLGFWIERLLSRGVKFEGPTRRFDEQVLAFADPDGLMLEIIATTRVAETEGWSGGPVRAEHAVRGVHAVTIWEDGEAGSAAFLTDRMGFRATGSDGNRHRFESGESGLGTVVDLRRTPGFWGGPMASAPSITWRTEPPMTASSWPGARRSWGRVLR